MFSHRAWLEHRQLTFERTGQAIEAGSRKEERRDWWIGKRKRRASQSLSTLLAIGNDRYANDRGVRVCREARNRGTWIRKLSKAWPCLAKRSRIEWRVKSGAHGEKMLVKGTLANFRLVWHGKWPPWDSTVEDGYPRKVAMIVKMVI